MDMRERATAMLEFFGTHVWLKGELLRAYDGEVVAGCLAGAEMQVAGDWSLVTPAVGEIAMAEYPERLKNSSWYVSDPTSAAVVFNNHPDTTFAELGRCLEKLAARETVTV